MRIFGVAPSRIPSYLSGTIHLTQMEAKKRPEDSFDHGNNAGVALLIPGFFRSEGVMRRVGEQLAEIMNVSYVRMKKGDWGDTTGMAYINHIIAGKVDTTITHDHPLLLIGHSMGGIGAAYVGAEKKKVSHIVQLASPNGGTPLFTNRFLDRNAIAQMMQGGNPYKEATVSNTGLKVSSIIALNDQVVPPESQYSWRIPWFQGEDIGVDTDHFGIITDKAIIAQYIRKLQIEHS